MSRGRSWQWAALCLSTYALGGPRAAAAGPCRRTSWGTAGAARVQAADPSPPGTLTLALSDELFVTDGLLAPGDQDRASRLWLGMVWAPVAGWEIGLRAGALLNKYTGVPSRTFQAQGDPSVLVKYSAWLSSELGLGAIAEAVAPTSAGGNGAALGALTLSGAAVATYRTPIGELSGNLGYVHDRSGQLLPQATALERFAFGLSSAGGLTLGVAATTRVVVGDLVAVAPYAELAGAYAPTAAGPVSQNPLRVGMGASLSPAATQWIEVSLGADWRLAGAPRPAGPYGGLPAWAGLAYVTLRAGGTVAPPTCERDADCVAGSACETGTCVAVRVVPQEKIVEREVVRAPAHLQVDGTVVDAASGAPIGTARIRVASYDSVLAVDDKSGTFVLWPVEAGDGLLAVTANADGYVSEQQVVSRNVTPEPLHMVFKLSAVEVVATATLQGAVKNSATGAPLPDARVFIPVLKESLDLNAGGSFSQSLQVGTYELLISRPGFVTQKKIIQLRANDVVILNVDLVPARGARGRR